MKAGEIKTFKIGRRTFITEWELDSFIEHQAESEAESKENDVYLYDRDYNHLDTFDTLDQARTALENTPGGFLGIPLNLRQVKC
jgi:hypothetical protein